VYERHGVDMCKESVGISNGRGGLIYFGMSDEEAEADGSEKEG